MNPLHDPWQALSRQARKTGTEGEAAPAGFATRVVARAFSMREDKSWLIGVAWRALAVAGAVTALTVVVNLSQLERWVDDEAALLNDLPAESETLDFS